MRFSLFFSFFEYFRIAYMEILTTFATYNCALCTKVFQAYQVDILSKKHKKPIET